MPMTTKSGGDCQPPCRVPHSSPCQSPRLSQPRLPQRLAQRPLLPRLLPPRSLPLRLRQLLLRCLLAVLLGTATLLAACDPGGGGQGVADGQNGQNGQNVQSGSGGAGPGASAGGRLVVGTMVTEDFLPMWVAEQQGIFEQQGIAVKLLGFQSAQELTTALAAGEVDMAMTDPMVAATLCAGGTEVLMEWVTLGETAKQGRFGIMASPQSGVTRLEDLAGRPIGVGSNTILEYVMDSLMAEAGVAAEQVKKEEIKKIPVRYEMMANNQVAAAALPASLLSLGEQSGMVLVADDTKGQNLSQSVMVVRREFAQDAGGRQAVDKLRTCWDKAAALVNASPDAYRALLVQKASLPEAIAESYPVSDYPLAKRPTNDMVDPILIWMLDKGYLEKPLRYDASNGAFIG